VLSWQEHIGSTIVHVLDFLSGEAYTAVTPAEGQFMRISGQIKVKGVTVGTLDDTMRYNMRNIVFSAWVTLDGYVSGPEDGKMEWLRGDTELMEYEQSFVDAADTLLMGRKTFNDFSKYWPPLARSIAPNCIADRRR
jgi:hypothetical protein